MEEDAELRRLRHEHHATFEGAWARQTARHGSPTCVVCAGQDWFFYASLMLPVGYFGQSEEQENTSKVHVAQFACRRCGYLLHFDTFTLVGDSLDP
jgi:hypothetical protein